MNQDLIEIEYLRHVRTPKDMAGDVGQKRMLPLWAGESLIRSGHAKAEKERKAKDDGQSGERHE